MCAIWNYDFICIMCLLYVFAFIVRASLFLGAIFGSNKLWSNGKVTVNNIWINDTNISRLYSFWIYISAWVHRFIFGEKRKRILKTIIIIIWMKTPWIIFRPFEEVEKNPLTINFEENYFLTMCIVCSKQLLTYICNCCSKIA